MAILATLGRMESAAPYHYYTVLSSSACKSSSRPAGQAWSVGSGCIDQRHRPPLAFHTLNFLLLDPQPL